MLAKLFGWLLPFKKHLILVAICSAILGAVYFTGKVNGTAECNEKAQKNITEGIKEHGKTKQAVMQLADPDLDKRLAKWMRD